MKTIIITIGLFTVLAFSSCESEQAKKERLAREEQERIEFNARQKQEAADREYRMEQERIEREIRLEQERKEKETYDKYINNSLQTGAMPYFKYYGNNLSCNNYNCSKIIVKSPYNSDVLVIIKGREGGNQHAYIRAGNSYTFEMPNGKYQPFFYYGKGWNPEKEMKNGRIKGGFISDESFGKDDPQSLDNNILTYELILQRNGNFSTKPSNPDEAL